MIRITGLNHRIGGAAILNGVDAVIPKGGITALIGPNGAGKSTLLHLIARLLPLQSGRIQVDGIDLARADTADLARRVAILPQNTGIPARLTVADLVAFGRWPHHRGRPGADDRRVIEEAISTFGLAPLAGRYMDELSGGQQQRAHVAMAHAQQTDWLLLDEPLNNLDPHHARDLMARLHAMSRPGPGTRSVVIVVHEVNYAAAWADHIVAMKDGRIVTAGKRETVMTEALMAQLYDIASPVLQMGERQVVLHHR